MTTLNEAKYDEVIAAAIKVQRVEYELRLLPPLVRLQTSSSTVISVWIPTWSSSRSATLS